MQRLPSIVFLATSISSSLWGLFNITLNINVIQLNGMFEETTAIVRQWNIEANSTRWI